MNSLQNTFVHRVQCVQMEKSEIYMSFWFQLLQREGIIRYIEYILGIYFIWLKIITSFKYYVVYRVH